jgi:hypothetical protein
MYVRVFCVVLPFVDRGLAMGRFPIHGVLQTYIKEFVVSEVSSEPEQARGLKP